MKQRLLLALTLFVFLPGATLSDDNGTRSNVTIETSNVDAWVFNTQKAMWCPRKKTPIEQGSITAETRRNSSIGHISWLSYSVSAR